MHTYDAVRLVAGEPDAVRPAIDALVASVWGSRARSVAADEAWRTDAIGADDSSTDADVWLTWQVEPHGGETRVRLVLDELGAGPDPSDEIAHLLVLLAHRVALAGGAREA